MIDTYHPLSGTAGGSTKDLTRSRVRLAPPGVITHAVGIAVVVGGLYALGAHLTFLVSSEPAAGLAFFPPAGVTLAALLLVRDRRMWTVVLTTVAVTEFAVDVGHGQSAVMAVGFAAANVLEPYVSARLLLRHPDARDLDRPVVFRRFVGIAVILGPMLGAVVGATTSALHGATSSWLSTFGSWWAGDSLGVLVVTTPIIVIVQRQRRGDAEPIPVAETATVAIAATAITVLSLFVWDGTPLYAVALVLVWAALRCGFTVVATVGFFVAWIADAATISGRGQYATLAGGDTRSALLYVQLFLGLTLISTLMLAAEAAERLRVQSELTRAEADRLRGLATVMEERNRIAGEVHDIVGHALNVVVLQVGAARRLMPIDSSRSLDILHAVEESARGGLRELDVALRVVGQPDSFEDEARGLAQLPLIVAAMGEAGVPVELRIVGDPLPLATLTDWSAYRVVQEALTNVLKHAGEASVRVTISYGLDDLSIEILDDGVGAVPGSDGAGHGLVGVRERVTALGGTLLCGGLRDGGYLVRANLPRESAS